MLIETLQQQLRLSWSRETSYYRETWTAENPAWGQCATTALVVQDLFGGEIIPGIVTTPDGQEYTHYWNRLEGKDVDLTWEQFPITSMKQEVMKDLKGFTSLRERMFGSSPTQQARYDLLFQRLKQGSSFELFTSAAIIPPMPSPLIVMTGGGSGGHITPIITLIDTIRSTPNPPELLWIGEKGAMEEEMSLKANIPFVGITTWKLRRYFSWRTFQTPLRILYGMYEAYRILSLRKPSVVFCKGGAAAVPVVVAAKILKIPIVAHESDTIPGIANRIASRFADTLFLGFESAKRFFPRQQPRVVGQIIQGLFAERAAEKTAKHSEKPHLLVIGWSQWSRSLIECVLAHRQQLEWLVDVTVILWKLNGALREKFQDWPSVKLIDFATPQEMAEIYTKTDIALTRSSGTTMAEMDLFFIRMIMVPLDVASFDHQYYNAREIEDACHILIRENSLWKEFIGALKSLVTRNYAQYRMPSTARSEITETLMSYCKTP